MIDSRRGDLAAEIQRLTGGTGADLVLVDDLQSYMFAVSGYDGSWRAVAARPGREWITYQLVKG